MHKNRKQKKSLEVMGKKGNPTQEGFASSAMQGCRAEEHLNTPRIQSNAGESDLLQQSLLPSALVNCLFHSDFYLTEVAFKPCTPDFRNCLPFSSWSMNHWQHHWAASPCFQHCQSQRKISFCASPATSETFSSTHDSLSQLPPPRDPCDVLKGVGAAEICMEMLGKLPHTWAITAASLVSALIQIQKTRSSHTEVFVLLVVWFYFCGVFFK